MATTAKKKSIRKRFNFWLDYKKQKELDLANEISNLKQTRSFSRAIRDGLRLFISLSKGDTSVLEELFPHVVSNIRGGSTGDSAGGLTEEKLRAIIWEATNDPTSGINMKPLPSIPTPKPLVLDDELPKVKVVKSEKQEGVNVAQNFLNGINALLNG